MSDDGGGRPPADRCPACGSACGVVHVHGHGQCAACGSNVDPCCSGAAADTEADQPRALGAVVAPTTFDRLFEQLGGAGATVTIDSARQALARMLDLPLDDAAMVLDLGVELGRLRRVGATLRRAVDAR